MSLLFWLWLGAYLVVGVVVALWNYRAGYHTEVKFGLMTKGGLVRVVLVLALLWLPVILWFLWECEVLPCIRRAWGRR